MQLQLYLRKRSLLRAALSLRVGFCLPKLRLLSKNHDVDTLTDEVRRIFHRYDCECVPLCENQLGVYRACDELADMWGLKSAPDSPTSLTSEPVTPAVDPSPTVTPNPSPSLFAEISKIFQRNFSVCNRNKDFDLNSLSGTSFHTPQQSNSALFETPESGETPQVCCS